MQCGHNGTESSGTAMISSVILPMILSMITTFESRASSEQLSLRHLGFRSTPPAHRTAPQNHKIIATKRCSDTLNHFATLPIGLCARFRRTQLCTSTQLLSLLLFDALSRLRFLQRFATFGSGRTAIRAGCHDRIRAKEFGSVSAECVQRQVYIVNVAWGKIELLKVKLTE